MQFAVNALILKEIKEVVFRKDYLFTLILNIIVFLVVGFIFISSTYEVVSLQNLFIEAIFIMIPPFAMWIMSFPYIQEKFNDQKILKEFDSLLTTPISIKSIWASKMITIFLLSYPIAIIVILMYLILWNFFGGINPLSIISPPVWLTILVIAPLVPMVYAAFSSWSILRFKHPRLMEVLNFFAIGIAVLLFISSGKIINNVASGQLIDWTTLAYSALALLVAFGLVYILVGKLDKEKITI